jgi:hypothetical protein
MEDAVNFENLRSKRVMAGISGEAVCRVDGSISRSKLSGIECGYVVATAEELRRIDEAIERIMRTRKSLADLAAREGLSLVGVRL